MITEVRLTRTRELPMQTYRSYEYPHPENSIWDKISSCFKHNYRWPFFLNELSFTALTCKYPDMMLVNTLKTLPSKLIASKVLVEHSVSCLQD
jgi:hypothetical protein